MVLLAVTTLLLFGIPLAVAVQRVMYAQAVGSLQRDAALAVATVPDNTLQSGMPPSVPRTTTGTRIGVYDTAGHLLAGHGPAHSALAAATANGRQHDGSEGAELVVVAPVLSDAAAAGSVRAAVPLTQLRQRVWRSWAALAVLAAVVLALTSLLARRAARRIATPFEQLTDATRDLGAGAFDVSLPATGLAEADAAGAALQGSARRLGTLVQRERDFVRHASHQLRTPLAGLVLELESLLAREPLAAAALERAHGLEVTLADLLTVRGPGQDRCDPLAVVRSVVDRWDVERPGSVELRTDETGPVALPAAAVRQALEVLLDNARRHGSSPVTVTVEPLGDSVVVEVSDQGAGFAVADVPGTGLRLAAALLQQYGGDLLVRRRAPHPRVALLMPCPTARSADPQSASKR